jgi:hypothetical protein
MPLFGLAASVLGGFGQRAFAGLHPKVMVRRIEVGERIRLRRQRGLD